MSTHSTTTDSASPSADELKTARLIAYEKEIAQIAIDIYKAKMSVEDRETCLNTGPECLKETAVEEVSKLRHRGTHRAPQHSCEECASLHSYVTSNSHWLIDLLQRSCDTAITNNKPISPTDVSLKSYEPGVPLTLWEFSQGCEAVVRLLNARDAITATAHGDHSCLTSLLKAGRTSSGVSDSADIRTTILELARSAKDKTDTARLLVGLGLLADM